MFAPPLAVNEFPHLPYWLRAKGSCLQGIDRRSEITPYQHPENLLACHIEGCFDYLRRYGVLMSLVGREYDSLAYLLLREMQHLLGTALLTVGVWDITRASVAEQHANAFPGHEAGRLYEEVGQVYRPDQPTTRERCHRIIFLFESFLRSLR